MSREVDERVVQMQFDNAQFERGTRQTMGTLEKLKQSLQFKGVEKGFERISSASQKVDFSEMTRALESIESKFSAVNVIAVTALTSITNKAIATGERLVKALSLDPIISGFQEYETQINAVQTILANTSSKGTTLDQVNAALDELNHYADLTIYNFTEMTRNIGTFTAAGVDLDTSVAAIKGIANLAAVSGSTSQQASTAMYQLSQALASGTVKLQDWNSVVNAGMGGQVFQDALKETARVHGVAIDSMIAKEGSFRETLSKGWLTSSILTETLQKFTGDLNEETLKSIGYTDEQIKKIMEIGKTANDAATKVKTFSQLKDTLTEALQSGWTQTWQTVIGDFEEAKELFTKFSDVFSDLINKSSEARNTVLEGGLNSGWQQLSTALGDSADFYSQMLEKVMLANGSISQKQIDDAGSFAKALQQGGVSAEQLQNGLNESTQQLQALSKLSDKELMAKGLDPTQVKALAKSFEEVNQKITDGSLNLDTYSKKIGELSGREHLIQSIWNIFEAIEKVVQPVMKAWQKMFSPVNAEQIYNIAEAIDSFTAKLSISDETADKIERTFSGVFAVLNVGRNALLAVGKVLGEVFNAASPLAGGFLSITAALGDCLVKMADAVNNSTVFKTVLDGIHWIIGKVSEGMQAFAGVLTNVSNNVSVVFDPLKTLGEWFMSFINFIAPGLYTFGSSADKIFKEFGASAKEAFNSLDTEKLANVINSGLVVGILAGVKGFLKGAQELTSSAGDVIGSIKNTVNAIKDVLNSLGEAIDAWKQSKKAETIMTIAKAVAIMAASLTVLSMIKPERLAGGIGALTATIGELVGAFLLLDKFGGKTKSTKLGAMSVAMVAMASSALILAGAAAKLASIDSGKLVSSIVALGSIMGGLTAVSVVLSKTGGKFMKGATGMIAFATAIRIMASAVNAMSGLSWDQMKVGLTGIGVLCIELGAFLAVSKFDKLGVLKGTGLILLATALNILQSAVAKFGSMNLNEIQNGLIAVGAALVEFAAFGIVAGFSKKMLASSASVLILSSSMVVLSRAMKSISGLDGEGIKKSLIAIGGALAEFVLALNLTKGTLGSAASLTTMTVAINLLVPALTGLGNLSLAQIGMGLLAIAGAFGVVGAAAMLLAPVAPVVIGLSLAISALAVSIGAMLALVNAADFFGRLGESLSALNGLSFQVFLANIKAMAWLLVEFVAGIFQGLATIAGSIASSIATIISAVCDGIAQAAPSIGNALAQLIVTVCNVIVQCSEPIGQALFTLGTVAIQTIIDLIAWAWDGGGGEGGGIKGALSSLWANITSFIGEKFNPANWFKEGSLLDGLFGAANKAADERDATEYGKSVGNKLAEGMDNSRKAIKESGVNLTKTVDDATKDTAGINSPSTMMEENGYWLDMGLAQGIEGSAGMSAVTAACSNISSVINGQFRDYWGIHSPSDLAYDDAGNIVAGLANGFTSTDQLQNGITTLNNGIQTTLLGGLDTTKTEATSKAGEIVSALNNVFSGTTTTAEDILKTLGGSGSTTTTNPTTTGSTTKSTKTGKTLAEQIAENYSKKLKSNKYLLEAADKEYSLWEAREGGVATSEQMALKRSEYVGKQISLQTNRVKIAQEQYDTLLKKVGKNNDKTREAYNTLLDEQKSLEELRRNQYDDLYSDKLDRYSADSTRAEKEYALWEAREGDAATAEELATKKSEYLGHQIEIQTNRVQTAQKQYDKLVGALGENDTKTREAYNTLLDEQANLEELKRNRYESAYSDVFDRYDSESSAAENEYSFWSNKYEKTATVAEKSNKQIELINKKIGIQAKALTTAEEEYTKTKEEFGEQSQKTQEAYARYLKKRIEYQQLVNDLNNAELDVFTAQNNRYALEMKTYSNQQSILLKLFEDGDYGVVTSTINMGAALRNMSYQLKRTTNAYDKYNEYVQAGTQNTDDGLAALHELQNERYSFIGYAEAFADALDMSDDAKKVTMQLGVAIADNWKTISNGFNKAWGKVQESYPEIAQKLSNFIGLYMRDGAAETITASMSAVVAAMNGDYGTAISSTISALLNFLGSDFGKTLMDTVKNGFTTYMPKIAIFIGKLFEDGGLLAGIGKAVLGLFGEGGALAGIGETVMGVLTTIAGVIGVTVPELGLIVLAIAAIGAAAYALIKNWDKVKEWFANFGEWISNLFQNIAEGIGNFVSNLVEGIGNVFKKIWEVGKNIGQGLWNGVTSVASGIWNGIKGLGSWIVNGFKSIFGIHSPSTVMTELGAYMGQGFANGITSTEDGVNRSMDDITNSALDIATNAARMLYDVATGQGSIEPIFTPVLNLSDYATPTSWAATQTYTPSAEAAERVYRSSELAQSISGYKNQNGIPVKMSNDNRDVVTAIGELGNRVDKMADAISKMKLVLDSGKTVGELTPKIDSTMGSRNVLAERGVI